MECDLNEKTTNSSPFLFAITGANGQILFVGVVNQPVRENFN
jgi:serine protease inhibitor